MPLRFPIEYELNPKHVEAGWRWLTVTLENVGQETLSGLEIQLNSYDDYALRTVGTGSYIDMLRSEERRVEAFQVAANRSGNVYITVEGLKGDTPFHWESPFIQVTVGTEVAELLNLFAVREPYPPVGERIRIEATIRGLAAGRKLDLEFWADTPGDDFKALGQVETKELAAGEQAVYAAEFLPQQEGLYTLYAYLYDGVRRIGRETERVQVREA